MIKVEKVMRIGKFIILMLCLCMLGLTACGEVTYPEEEQQVKDALDATVSSIVVHSNGRVSSTIVEEFAESYYDESGLKAMIESSIDEYKSSNATAEIELKSFKIKDGMTNILMEYGDYQAYAGYNREDFFAGTIRDANMAGFDLNVTLKSVADNTEVSKPELLGMGDSHIIIIGNAEEPEQIRVNCFDDILYVGDGVNVVGKESADIVLSEDYKIIVFK